MEGGKASNGATKPDRNKYGINSNRSIALARSFQKQIIENSQCNKKRTVKARNKAMGNKIISVIEGYQNELGKNKNKIRIITKTIGNLLICSAMCDE